MRTTRPIIMFLLTLLVLATLTSCGDSGSAPRTWTIMVYLDGDNSLGNAALADLDELRRGVSSPFVQVVVQLDLPDGVPTRRYLVANGQLLLQEELGELDMSAEETLTDFLKWGKEKYPADRTVLILWDHGNGWDQGGGTAKRTASMFTDQDNRGANAPFLPNYRIRNAIQTSGIRLDTLGLDGCSMGTVEALYEFRGLAEVIIASEELASLSGWDYRSLLSGLAAAPAMSAEDFGRMAVAVFRTYYEYAALSPEKADTLVALRGSAMEGVAEKVNAMAVQLLARMQDPGTGGETVALLSQVRDQVQEIDRYAQAFVYVDLVDLANRLGMGALLSQAVSDAIIAEYHGSSRPGAHGLSIVFFKLPEAKTYNTFDAGYRNFDPATNSGNRGAFINAFLWDEMLASYYVRAGL